MSNNKETSPSLKRNWFQEFKAEFKKVTWPKRESLFKQAVAVMTAAIILGCIITFVDMLLNSVLSYIIG